MTDNLELPDAVLVDRLRPLIEADDPVPAEVIAAARAASTWRLIDQELAELAEDSVGQLAGVRGGGPRLLTYRAGGLTVEIEVSTADERMRILGQVVPPMAARVRVEQVGGAIEVTTDELGRFRVGDLTPGSTRLCITPAAAGRPVQTEWTLL